MLESSKRKEPRWSGTLRRRWTLFTFGPAGLLFGASRVWLCAGPPASGPDDGQAGLTGHSTNWRLLSRQTSRIPMANQQKKITQFRSRTRLRFEHLPKFSAGIYKPVAPYVREAIFRDPDYKKKTYTVEELYHQKAKLLLDDRGNKNKKISLTKRRKILPAAVYQERLDMPKLDPPWQQWYIGRVKAYSPSNGFGFIYCEETMKQYGSDVFLHRDQVGDVNRIDKGTMVQFMVDLNKLGRPQAQDINRRLTGRVKSFDAQGGYGFITSDVTAEAGLGDIFLHRQEFEAAQVEVGDLVTFTCRANAKAQLNARDVQLATEGLSLIREDTEQGKMMLQD